jgi:hypothetical protein
MPSHKEFYDALKNISVNADTLNLNTDQVESKLDTATGLLTTLSADTAIIKTDMANGVLSDVRDGSGNALTSSARGSQRALSVQVVDGSGNQITSFGSSSVSVSNFPSTQAVSGTFWPATQPVSGSVSVSNFPATQPISGTVTANTGLTQPLTDTQLRASSVAVSNTSNTGATPTEFSSTTYATISASNANRKGLTIFNEGAGLLYVTLGTSTTTATSYTIRLSAGDYYEVPFGYTGLVGGIFATTGTARVTQIS